MAVCWACILVHNPLGAESTGLPEKTLHANLISMWYTLALTRGAIQIRLQHHTYWPTMRFSYEQCWVTLLAPLLPVALLKPLYIRLLR